MRGLTVPSFQVAFKFQQELLEVTLKLLPPQRDGHSFREKAKATRTIREGRAESRNRRRKSLVYGVRVWSS